jgi:hypothetical protein
LVDEFVDMTVVVAVVVVVDTVVAVDAIVKKEEEGWGIVVIDVVRVEEWDFAAGTVDVDMDA